MFSFAYVLAAEKAPQSSPPPGSGFVSLLPLLLIFAVFYFILIRPQQKEKKKHHLMLGNLKKGDKVVTNGGIYGTIVDVKEKTVIVRIGEEKGGLTIELLTSSVVSLRE